MLEELNKNRQKSSLAELSENLKIPIRTISNYIQEFNNYNLSIYIISNNRGVQLVIPKETSFRYIYSIIFQKSLELSLLEQIFLTENLTLNELADLNFVSLSTVKRAISRIKLVLKNEGISLSTSNVSITGDEEKVRQLLNYFYDEKYIDLEFLTPEKEQCLHTIVQNIFREKRIKIYKNQVNKYIRWIYLNSVRIKNHHRVSVKNYRFNPSQLLSNNSFLNEFEFLFGIPLTIETINDMLYQLNNNYYYHSYDQIKKMTAQSKELKDKVTTIKNILQNISKDLEINLSSSTEQMLTLDFINILQFKNYRTFILYNRREVFLEHLSTKYLHIKQYLSTYIVDLLGFNSSQSEINELIYILITHWYELYNYLHKIEKCIDIYIFTDTDLEHALFIKKELENHCRYNIKCHLLMDDEPFNISNSSILVTNLAMSDKNIKNVISFSDYFSDRNWYDLNNQIRKLSIEKTSLGHKSQEP